MKHSGHSNLIDNVVFPLVADELALSKEFLRVREAPDLDLTLSGIFANQARVFNFNAFVQCAA